ncbi:unnamed protein product [Somion occarium]|uniref:G domain-containing protein n=1 Tax=Somion occarium TaxID=3059160 RepID=A0ABP1DNE8_9APHY
MAELTVAVMGATGTGKSTFINLVSGSNFQVGSGLLSSTTQVQSSQPFDIGGRRMVLIDTPGFDDSTRTDTDILRTISTYLENTYRNNKKLSGVIYMHRISDPRMSGISRRNFGMFRKLCGDSTLGSVIIVTNMWGEIREEVGVQRERELATEDILFKPVLDKGAKMMRHYNTLESGRAIVEQFVNKEAVTLKIQDEVVREGKSVEQTAAGAELEAEKQKELAEARRKQEEEIRRAQEAMRLKMEEEERRHKAEIEAARVRAEAEAARQREAYAREMARQAEERRREEAHRREVQRQLEAQLAAQAAKRRRQEEEAQRVQQEMVRQQQEAAAAQQRLREEVERLHHESNDGGCVIF